MTVKQTRTRSFTTRVGSGAPPECAIGPPGSQWPKTVWTASLAALLSVLLAVYWSSLFADANRGNERP
jgi:hypothetical protein